MPACPRLFRRAIGARIDRLESIAKRTINAASVIGSVFDDDSLKAFDEELDVAALIEAELVDQVKFSPRAVYTCSVTR